MWLWDYHLPKNFSPENDAQWRWYLVRKINYGDFAGITKKTLRKHFNAIKRHLDPGKREMIQNYLQQ